MNTKKIMLLAGVMAATVMAGAARADDTTTTGGGFQAGDILVRGRVEGVLPSVTSTVSAIGGQVSASNSMIPELDASYFFTQNIAVEAIAGITRHHLVDKNSTAGNVDLGRVTLLPPTVTAQYHFLPTAMVNPYLGAGVNYTMFFDHELPTGSAATSIHYNNSVGTALQAGADIHIQGNWYANVDVKHIFLATTAKINSGTIVGNVNLDPTIVGLGVGYKF